MLGLNSAIDQLAIACSVRWYGHVVRRGHLVLRLKVKGKKEIQCEHGRSRLRQNI